jgi:hypothetical protein
MEVVVACCAGLDVHQATVVACINRTGRGGRSHKEVRTFATMRDDLIALRNWLQEGGVSLVAMEAPAFTGSRCMPRWRTTSS